MALPMPRPAPVTRADRPSSWSKLFGPRELGGGWQERQDSNPRPSVLETDALTRLSYAPVSASRRADSKAGASAGQRADGAEPDYTLPLTLRRSPGGLCGRKTACKPSSVRRLPAVYASCFFPRANCAATIYLAPTLPPGSSGQPGEGPGTLLPRSLPNTGQPVSPARPCSGWGLPCPRRLRRGGELLPHHFTLTPHCSNEKDRAVCFCGTFRRVAPPRR